MIKIETSFSISESTLYRLFLWQKNKNSPYLHTLEILAKFIGYSSWRDLEINIKELNTFQFSFGVLYEEKNHNSLLKVCIHSNTLKPLHNFLEQFPEQIPIDKQYLIGHEIYKSLKSNPNKNLMFFKNFQKTPIVRSSFYEIMADPDFSIPQYEQGLIYYLDNLKPHQSTKAMQDYIFAHCILIRHYFVSNKRSKVLKTGILLYNDLKITSEEIENLHIFPRIRYFCYKLLFNYAVMGFDKEYWIWLKIHAFSLADNSTFENQRIIIHTVLDTLQINPSLQQEMFNEFLLLYPEMFEKFPDYFQFLSINQRIKFLDPNASTSFNKLLFF